ncbi:uncharacterized protein LOC106432094 [Brassica napus]|uniref:uncharacterized protein LOC106432094 n=1 Tax=Brassica napus TaxID=3708 RepID=UPI0006AAFBE7|nr:uncharacterized protein LOC106432094 [Brassica napus]
MKCVSSVAYSYLINGAAQGRVVPTRGIRQGDPLSPYLFILCTEVLSGLCKKAQSQGEVVGIKVSRNSPAINHLLFADDTMFFHRTDSRSCTALLSILKKYEGASGQCINLEKSSITFGAKTLGEDKRRIRELFHIENEGGIGKYLGLPEHFGRKKRNIFAALVDRMRQKAQSWTSRFLSGAGKMVLLKAVLAAMPTYSMSCFKLPLSLVKQLQSVLTRFLWDLSPEIKKMCWVSCSNLPKPKNAGGLGFREIAQFNDATLAKISWRILKDPNSLLARIVIGKYCMRTPFLEEVSIWTEPWLSTSEPISPIGPPTNENQFWSVSKLIDPTSKDWNVAAIQETLPQYEEDIRKLIPSSFQLEDERVWLPNANGIYSTRSGYAIAKLFNGNVKDKEFDWKKCVWQVETSPKIKHFLWKSNCKALPVGSLLEACGLSVSPVCRRCGAQETGLHILLQCPFAVKEAPPLYLWVLWGLWTNRNKLLFEDKSFSEECSVLKAIQDARAWKAAQTYVEKPSLPHYVVPYGSLPTANSYTWSSFSDAAWDSSTGNCGMGWQLRDSLDVCAETSSSHRRFVPSALMAEALAVKAALTAAISSHVSSLRVYSDSKSLILLLKSQGQDVSLKGVLHDIKILARSFESISFCFIPRLANSVADSIAKTALYSLHFSVLVTE